MTEHRDESNVGVPAVYEVKVSAVLVATTANRKGLNWADTGFVSVSVTADNQRQLLLTQVRGIDAGDVIGKAIDIDRRVTQAGALR
jgi:hypothetical protein